MNEKIEKLIREITKKDILIALLTDFEKREKREFRYSEIEEIINKV